MMLPRCEAFSLTELGLVFCSEKNKLRTERKTEKNMGILKQQPLLSFSHLQFLFHRYFVLSYIIGKMHWKILF